MLGSKGAGRGAIAVGQRRFPLWVAEQHGTDPGGRHERHVRHKGHFLGQRPESAMVGCISQEGAAARQRGPTRATKMGQEAGAAGGWVEGACSGALTPLYLLTLFEAYRGQPDKTSAQALLARLGQARVLGRGT